MGRHFASHRPCPGPSWAPWRALSFPQTAVVLLTGHYDNIRAWRLADDAWKPEATFTPHHELIRDMKFSRGRDEARHRWPQRNERSRALGREGGRPLLYGRCSSPCFGSGSPPHRNDSSTHSLAGRIVSALTAADIAPRDMFETEVEYAARRSRAQVQAASLLQEETEKHFSAERAPAKGALYEVSVPLQSQGSYAIDTRTYTFAVHGHGGDAEARARPRP